MEIDTQDYLRLVENSNSICFFDLESTGLKGDYNSVLVVSIKPIIGQPITFSIKQLGNDQKVVRDAKECLESFDCWVSYYGKGFDIKMLNTRLLKWGHMPIDKRPHIDMYYALKNKLATGRKSQAHLLEWLGTPQKKMTVGASVWSEMGFKMKTHMPTMIERCQSDTEGLQAMYERTKHLIGDINR